MPFWADGAMVDGLREGTAKSQEMNHVSVLSLAQQAVSTSSVSSGLAPLFAIGGGSPSSRPSESSTLPAWQTTTGLRLPSVAVRRALVAQVCAAVFIVLALVIAVVVARGGVMEAGVVATLMLFSLLLTNLYPWYLIPIVACVALWQSRRGLGYVFVGTTLGLAYYPAYVYARFGSGWDELNIHLFLALFLTVPMLIYLLAEAGGFVIQLANRRRGNDQPLRV